MKIAITGHTRGIGKFLFENLTNDGHEVLGFSYSTGFDISKKENRDIIARTSADYDVFINSCYNYRDWDNSQLDMLKEIYSIWEKDVNKHIINISSAASNMHPFTGVIPGIPKYSNYVKAKWEQDEWCLKKRNILNDKNKVKLTNIKPGRVLVEKFHGKWKEESALSLKDFYSVIKFILESPRIEFSNMSLNRH